MEELSGSYYPQQQIYDLYINRSENISKKQIEDVCKTIINEKIEDLTLEFDDGNFIFFTKLKEKIRFIEGSNSDFAMLHQKAKKDLDGKIIRPETSQNNTNLSESITTAIEIEILPPELDEKVMIQHSLFSTIEHFNNVFSKAEIYFKPYEDPGGDFYWVKEYGHHSLVVVGDCTGHGIQGAMISMSVLTMIKQFFKSFPESIEASIHEFYDQLRGLLEEEEFDIFDTEIGLILLDHETLKASYIGSGVNLIVKTTDSINIHTTRKHHIVKKTQKSIELLLENGDQLFLFTDGIPDQFDQFNKRKLGTRGLFELLEKSNGAVTLENFTNTYDSFKGTTEALDDQTLLMLTI